MSGKILIIDEMAASRIVMRGRLRQARYQVAQTAAWDPSLLPSPHDMPDLIMIGTRPDPTGQVPASVMAQYARLRAAFGEGLPIMVNLYDGDRRAILPALQAGLTDIILHPSDEVEFLARLRALLRQSRTLEATLPEAAEFALTENAATQNAMTKNATTENAAHESAAVFRAPYRIALVMADREAAVSWKLALSQHLRGDTVMILLPDEALTLAASARCPEVFLIEADRPDYDAGPRLIADMRARTGGDTLATCLLTQRSNAIRTAHMLDLGANDVVVQGGVTPSHIPAHIIAETALRLRRQAAWKRRVKCQREVLRNELRLATIDPLTGLHNRRYAMTALHQMAARAHDRAGTFAVIVLDLDRFKSINDTWGHNAGDSVLATIAHRLRRELRAGDLLARIGGEEFLIALPDADPAQGWQIAERLCSAIRATPISLPFGGDITVTASLGVAIGPALLPAAGSTTGPATGPASLPGAPGWPSGRPSEWGNTAISDLIECADQALRGSKHDGRNQVTVFQSSAA